MASRRPKRPRDPNHLGKLTGNMLNPLKWKPEHRVALLVASVAGDRLALLYGPAARCKPKVMIWKVGLAHLYPASHDGVSVKS